MAGSEPVDSSRAGDGGQEPASPLQGGPVTVEAGLTGGNFPELAEVKAEGEVPVETGPQGEPAAAKIFRMTAEAAMETGTVQEETGRPVEVSGTTPVTEEQLPDGAGLTWEAVKEESQAPGIVQVLTGTVKPVQETRPGRRSLSQEPWFLVNLRPWRQSLWRQRRHRLPAVGSGKATRTCRQGKNRIRPFLQSS